MLKDKSVIVIGGSSGIGLAVATAAINAGAHVTIASRSKEKLTLAKEKIGGNIYIAQLDVLNENEIKQFFASQQKIDHLVYTANNPKFHGIKDMSIAEARQDLDQLFWPNYMVAKYAMDKMDPQGSIIFTSGTLAAKPAKDVTLLSAALNAIEGFAKSLAIDITPIRVNVLSPGLTKTPLLGDNPEQTFSGMINKLLIKRLATPEEMAQTVMYLLTNNYITGQTIRVDGGLLFS
jgi:NAD(P)-dependent dehydrogenase (short-subunit alcohol dehydrogenase family)